MSGNEHDGSNIEPVAKRLHALKGSLGMVIEQSPLAIHVLTPDGFPLLSNSSWKNLWNPGEDPVSRNVFQDKQLQAGPDLEDRGVLTHRRNRNIYPAARSGANRTQRICALASDLCVPCN